MASVVTYQYSGFDEAKVARRYASKWGAAYKIFDVNEKGATIRETVATRDELPGHVADNCDSIAGRHPNQVRIPD